MLVGSWLVYAVPFSRAFTRSMLLAKLVCFLKTYAEPTEGLSWRPLILGMCGHERVNNNDSLVM